MKLLSRSERSAEGSSIYGLTQLLRRDRLAMVALLFLLTIGLVAIAAPAVAPHSPTRQDLSLRLQPPAWMEGGSATHLLGTDQLGRDNLSRIIFAARVSLSVALAVVGITLVIGTALGVAAGYFGGRLDHAIMALTDVLMAFPGLLLVMALAALLGPGLGTIIAALSVRFWTTYARISRGMVLTLKETDFMMAARVVGGTRAWSVRTHLLPNMISPLATLIPLELGRVMLSEAAVSFLGLGVQPPSASWGILVADGRAFISSAWWLITFAGLALFLTVLNANMLGGWLRLATDPVHRGGLGSG